MSGPKLDTVPEPMVVTLTPVQQGAGGAVVLEGRSSRLPALGRYLGNQRFSSLLTGGQPSEFDIALGEFSPTAPPAATPLAQSTALQSIDGKAALGTRAELQLLWEPYSGEAFWPLGAGETTKSWLPSVARESWFNKRDGKAASSGNDLLVCKLEPGGGAQVFKVILNEQKAVAEREFLKTTAISSSLLTNVRHNIALLQQRADAPGIDAEQRDLLRRTIDVLQKTEAALTDATGKTPLPPEIQFELTSLGGAAQQFGIGNRLSHLRILARNFGEQGEKGSLLEDIISHTAVRDRALAARLRAAGVLDPNTTDLDIVPMRRLLTPQATAWLALQSGLTPEHWLTQAGRQQRAAAGQAAYDQKKLQALAQLQTLAVGKGQAKKWSPEQLEKQADKLAAKAQKDAEKQFDKAAFKRNAFDSTGSVVDRLAGPTAAPAADMVVLEKRAAAASTARAMAEAEAAEPGASRSSDAYQGLLLARSEDLMARITLADAVAARDGTQADASKQMRAELAQSTRALNEMGEVARLGLEFQQLAETPRSGSPTVVVGETPALPARPAASPTERTITPPPVASRPRYTAQRGAPMGPLSQGGPSPMGEAVGGAGQLLVDVEVALAHEAAYRNARKSQSLRTLHWWLLKGVYPQAAGVTDRWAHTAGIPGTTAFWWELAEDERETDLRQIVIGANEGRFDGIEVEAPSRTEQYEAFERWVRANVHSFEDLYLHFIHDMDPGVRWDTNTGAFKVVAWAWGDMPPANVSDTWVVDPRINQFMQGIKTEIYARTQQETANLSAQDVRLGKSGAFRLGAKRCFREGYFVDRSFQYPETGFRPLIPWPSKPVFYEIEYSGVPPGFALVTGADARTYWFIVEARARYGHADTRPTLSRGGPDALRLPTVLPETGWNDLTLPVVLVDRESLE
jgi:hypothetical protein